MFGRGEYVPRREGTQRSFLRAALASLHPIVMASKVTSRQPRITIRARPPRGCRFGNLQSAASALLLQSNIQVRDLARTQDARWQPRDGGAGPRSGGRARCLHAAEVSVMVGVHDPRRSSIRRSMACPQRLQRSRSRPGRRPIGSDRGTGLGSRRARHASPRS